jgi:hypothetical protein
VIGLAITLFIILRCLFPERPDDYIGPCAIFDAVFSLALLTFILLLAYSLGAKIQCWLGGNSDLVHSERLFFRLAIGLGVIAYGILLMGLLGVLSVQSILLWLVLAAFWSWRGWTQLQINFKEKLTQLHAAWNQIEFGPRVLVIFALSIFFLSLSQAMTPPWDCDGLMYHLQAPKLFLKAGKLLLLPDIWQANGPLTTEMLYMLGLAFGSATFAKLLHLTYAAMLVIATYSLANRLINRTAGWLSAAILIGIPIFPIWGTLAIADMAWALHEFLSLYAVILWMERKQSRWLILAGLMMGLGIGSKYLALGMFGILAIWILWESRHSAFDQTLQNVFIFVMTTSVVGSPWYMKNLIWSGNPVYPFFFGGREWSSERISLLMEYLRGFGVGHTLRDYILLPWNLYTQHEKFGTFMQSIEFPSFLFPLALLFPLTRKKGRLGAVFAITGARFICWAIGSQQTRFLLPLFPALSLLSSAVMLKIGSALNRPLRARTICQGILGGMVVTTLIYQVIFLVNKSPLGVITGFESKDMFLQRAVYNYSSLQFAQRELPSSARIMMLWSGQGYYCDSRCWPDAEQSRWTGLIQQEQDVMAIANRINSYGVTHILLDLEGMNFSLNHDPHGKHAIAAEFYFNQFRQTCAKEIYRDQYMILDEITCN